MMVPRHDGEWDAIRAAIAEDEADRAEATAGKTAVNDRLDALCAAAALWRGTDPVVISGTLRATDLTVGDPTVSRPSTAHKG
jgi:hypothetical protein